MCGQAMRTCQQRLPSMRGGPSSIRYSCLYGFPCCLRQLVPATPAKWLQGSIEAALMLVGMPPQPLAPLFPGISRIEFCPTATVWIIIVSYGGDGG